MGLMQSVSGSTSTSTTFAPNSNGAWAVRVYIKPFVDWIWAGCLLMSLGGILAISDRRYRIHNKRSAEARTEMPLEEKTA